MEQANYFTPAKIAETASLLKGVDWKSLDIDKDQDPSGKPGYLKPALTAESKLDTASSLHESLQDDTVQPGAEFLALVEHLASDTSATSPMQQRLDRIQFEIVTENTRKRLPIGRKSFDALTATLSESGAELKSWNQLINHLKVAIRRWKKSKTLIGIDAQVSLSLAYAHSRQLQKAIFLASELIRSATNEVRSPKLMSLCAVLTQMCLASNDHDLVLDMWAANAEPFLTCLRDPGAPTSPSGILRASLQDYCTSMHDPETLVRQRFDKETSQVKRAALRQRRLGRIAEILLTASTVADADQAALIYHAFARLSVKIPPPAESSLWTDLLATGDRAGAWRVLSESSLSGLMTGRLQVRNAHQTLSRVVSLAQGCGHLQTARSAFAQIQHDGYVPTVRDTELLLRTCAAVGPVAALEAVVEEFFPDDLRLLKTDALDAQEGLTTGNRTSQQRRRAITRAYIRVHVAAEDLAAVEPWWQRLQMQSGGPNTRDYNILMQLYARKGDFAQCQLLLEEMSRSGVEPDAASFTSVMAAHASKRDYIAAGRTIADMQQRGIVVDPIAIGSMMNVAIETGNWQGVAKIYESLDESMRLDSAIAGTMMKALMLLGAPYDEIKKLFSRTFPVAARASQRAWSIIIQSACDAGRVEDAHKFLTISMLDEQPFRQPNSYAFTVLVAFYLRKGDIINAKRVFSQMDYSGVPLTSVAYSLVIRSLLKDNSVDKDSVHRFAEELLVDRPWSRVDPRGRGCDTENIITPVMMEASRLGNTAQVEQYMQRLAEQDVIPSITVSTILMDAYRKAGDLDKMRMVWKHIFRSACQMREMRDRNGPSNILCIPWSIFLDGLTTACQHGEAFDTWRLLAENGFGFDAQNWNHLAVALMRSGQPERAFDVVENVLLEKAEQVKSRTSPIVRESASSQDETSHWHETDIFPETPLEGDLQDEAAMRPPNRRHQYRRGVGTENPYHDPGDVASRLLRSWRPADITWRPTFLTIAVLERAYTQLENGIPIMALLAGQEEEIEDGFLPPRGNALAEESATGRSSKSPIVLLARMNRRYARTVSLIMLHRRKRKSRQTRKSKKMEPNKIVKTEGY